MKAALLLAGLTLSMLLANAQARLGWTLEECVAKYGRYTISSENVTLYDFHVGIFQIGVLLTDGRVVSIGYAKSEAFTPEEIEELKAKNGADFGVIWSNNPTITDSDNSVAKSHRVSWDATKPGATPFDENALIAFYSSTPKLHDYQLVIRTKAEAIYLEKLWAMPHNLKGL